jgi:hypothetical protein
VASVAASTRVPYTEYAQQQPIATDAADSNAVKAEPAAISASFVSTLNVPVRAGRAFTLQDSTVSRTAIVNEALAGRLFPGRNAVGSRIWIAQASYDIVGVVADYGDHWFEIRRAAPKIFLLLSPNSTALKRLPICRARSGRPSVARASSAPRPPRRGIRRRRHEHVYVRRDYREPITRSTNGLCQGAAARSARPRCPSPARHGADRIRRSCHGPV